jgi:hypothetical protein
MFEIKKLDDARIQEPALKSFVNNKLMQLYPEGNSFGLDTQIFFIESMNDLEQLGVFDDEGFIDFIEYHARFNCFEVYLESDALLIVPDVVGANQFFNEVLNHAYCD